MPKNGDDILINDDLYDDKETKKGGKMITSLIAVFIVLIWIAIFALLIKLDVGGFGSSVLYPILKDVPVVNLILPESDGSISSDSGSTYDTLQEAIDRINELENELAIYKQNADDNAQTISILTAEVSRLKPYEDNQAYFEEIKKKFDKEVVYAENAPTIEEYQKWYKEMYPENADLIYRQVEDQLAMDAVVQKLADSYATMKPAAAAAIFEEMTGDLDKVASILSCMKKEDAAEILAAMDSTLAAKLTLLIYPVSEE